MTGPDSKKGIFLLLGFAVLASGCISSSSSSGSPEIQADNITISQGSSANITTTVRNVNVLAVADPERVISRPDTGFLNPQPRLTPNYNTDSPEEQTESNRIGWILQWRNPTNATVQLPVDTSKEPGNYRFSVAGITSGMTDSKELQITITESANSQS